VIADMKSKRVESWYFFSEHPKHGRQLHSEFETCVAAREAMEKLEAEGIQKFSRLYPFYQGDPEYYID
jgi:hypothetical protein